MAFPGSRRTKVRARNPIVDIYLQSNPQRIYSIGVPSSKSWNDFINKIYRQFNINLDTPLSIYLDTSTDDDIRLSIVDTDHGNMNHIKHRTKFCVFEDVENLSSSSAADSSSDTELHTQPIKTKENGIELNECDVRVDLYGRCDARFKSKKYRASNKCNPWTVWKNLQNETFQVTRGDEWSLLSNDKYTIRVREHIWPIHFINNTFTINDLNQLLTCVIICHGGRFAGAIFRAGECIEHKTFHRYVVRKKQGKRQQNHLSNGGRSNSAGGQKRALMEIKFRDDTRKILFSWSKYLLKCERIWLHAPGPINESALFGTPQEQYNLYESKSSKEYLQRCLQFPEKLLFRLWKNNPKLKKIPCPTYGVKFKEVNRVHQWLNQMFVIIHQDLENT